MGVRIERGIELQHVAADDAARRVHQHVVAHAGALRVQALQHAQGAGVTVVRDRALAVARVVQRELRVPAHQASFTTLGIGSTSKAPACRYCVVRRFDSMSA